MMKKLFSLLLAVILVLGAGSALADMPKDAVPGYDDEGNLLGYYKSETDKKTGVVTTYWYDENGKLTQKQKDTSTQSDWEAYDEAGNSTVWIVPSAQSNQMEPVLVTIQPHASLPVDDPHNGEEFGYVLSGRIALYRQETRLEVKTGESFYYEADKPHRIENPGNRPAKLLWVSTPPSF